MNSAHLKASVVHIAPTEAGLNYIELARATELNPAVTLSPSTHGSVHLEGILKIPDGHVVKWPIPCDGASHIAFSGAIAKATCDPSLGILSGDHQRWLSGQAGFGKTDNQALGECSLQGERLVYLCLITQTAAQDKPFTCDLRHVGYVLFDSLGNPLGQEGLRKLQSRFSGQPVLQMSSASWSLPPGCNIGNDGVHSLLAFTGPPSNVQTSAPFQAKDRFATVEYSIRVEGEGAAIGIMAESGNRWEMMTLLSEPKRHVGIQFLELVKDRNYRVFIVDNRKGDAPLRVVLENLVISTCSESAAPTSP